MGRSPKARRSGADLIKRCRRCRPLSPTREQMAPQTAEVLAGGVRIPTLSAKHRIAHVQHRPAPVARRQRVGIADALVDRRKELPPSAQALERPEQSPDPPIVDRAEKSSRRLTRHALPLTLRRRRARVMASVAVDAVGEEVAAARRSHLSLPVSRVQAQATPWWARGSGYQPKSPGSGASPSASLLAPAAVPRTC